MALYCFFPLLSSLGFHCLSEEVGVWRQNNLRLLYIIGVTGRALFTQPETRTLRKTAGGGESVFFFFPSHSLNFFFATFAKHPQIFGGRHHQPALPTVCVCGGGVGRGCAEHEGKSLWFWREMTSWQKSSHDFVPSATVAEKWDARTQIVLLWKQNVTGWESQ